MSRDSEKPFVTPVKSTEKCEKQPNDEDVTRCEMLKAEVLIEVMKPSHNSAYLLCSQTKYNMINEILSHTATKSPGYNWKWSVLHRPW